MKTTEIKDVVSYVLGLFETLVMLVAWPKGIKGGKGVDFRKITLKEMMDPDYRRKLAEGNIGVVQGEASGGIASIDIDDDAGAREFLELNPDLKETLRTRGARGCNIWFYPEGKVPGSCNLKRHDKPWGEWRFNGRQTIIAGMHPSGVPYTIQCAAKAIRHPFEKIKFPAGVTARFIRSTDSLILPSISTDTEEQKTEPQSVVLCSPLCPSVYSEGSNGVLESETMETLLAGTVPTERHGNHERLFTLARRVKAFEMGRSAPLGEAELQAIFSLWHQRAAGFLRADQSWDEYYYDFTEAYGDVQRPRGDAVVDIAWRAISTTSGVSGQSKPARSGHFKTGHFEGVIALGAARAATMRNEPTRSEYSKIHHCAGRQGLVTTPHRTRAGDSSRNGRQVSGRSRGSKTSHCAHRLNRGSRFKTGHSAPRLRR